jgi:hypothetical protein
MQPDAHAVFTPYTTCIRVCILHELLRSCMDSDGAACNMQCPCLRWHFDGRKSKWPESESSTEHAFRRTFVLLRPFAQPFSP